MKTIILSDSEYALYRARLAGESIVLQLVGLKMAIQNATVAARKFAAQMEFPK